MIHYIKGDITSESCGLLLQSVNCQSKMGSGLAKAIRDKWPIVYDQYLEFLKGSKLGEKLGSLQIIEINKELCIGNLFGQIFYGYDGKRYAYPDAIECGMIQAINFCLENNIQLKTVKLGCGLGGLSWEEDIKPIFEKLSKDLSCDILVFES